MILISCPFGTVEEMLREKEYPSEPDKEILTDGKVLLLSGIRAHLPYFSADIHEGFFCHRKESGELEPEAFVCAVVDSNTGELLYDEVADFVETVFAWKNCEVPLEEIENLVCVVKGIAEEK